jgi:hypothetical protein
VKNMSEEEWVDFEKDMDSDEEDEDWEEDE